jgi:hypothetical protein
MVLVPLSKTQSASLALDSMAASPGSAKGGGANERSQVYSRLQSQRRTRKHAQAKITVQSCAAKPYDAAEECLALTEIRLIERFTGDIDGKSPVRALQVLRHDHSVSRVSVQRFSGRLADARAPSCFKVKKSSRMARSRRRGLSFPDRERETFPGYAVRAALKANLEKNPPERWIIGSTEIIGILSGKLAVGASSQLP